MKSIRNAQSPPTPFLQAGNKLTPYGGPTRLRWKPRRTPENWEMLSIEDRELIAREFIATGQGLFGGIAGETHYFDILPTNVDLLCQALKREDWSKLKIEVELENESLHYDLTARWVGDQSFLKHTPSILSSVNKLEDIQLDSGHSVDSDSKFIPVSESESGSEETKGQDSGKLEGESESEPEDEEERERNAARYQLSYTLTRAGSYKISVSVAGYAVLGSPFDCVITPSFPSHLGTFIEGPAKECIPRNQQTWFMIVTADEFGNQTSEMGHDIEVFFPSFFSFFLLFFQPFIFMISFLMRFICKVSIDGPAYLVQLCDYPPRPGCYLCVLSHSGRMVLQGPWDSSETEPESRNMLNQDHVTISVWMESSEHGKLGVKKLVSECPITVSIVESSYVPPFPEEISTESVDEASQDHPNEDAYIVHGISVTNFFV